MASQTACVCEHLAPTYEPPWSRSANHAPGPAPAQDRDIMPITLIGTHVAAPVVLGSMPVT